MIIKAAPQAVVDNAHKLQGFQKSLRFLTGNSGKGICYSVISLLFGFLTVAVAKGENGVDGVKKSFLIFSFFRVPGFLKMVLSTGNLGTFFLQAGS